MVKKDSKKDLFQKLKIEESEYPEYRNPDQFASGIRKASLLEAHEIRYSNTTAAQKGEND